MFILIPIFLPVAPAAGCLTLPNEMTAAVDVARPVSARPLPRATLLDNQSINMQLVDGPFRKLMGGWQFTPLSEEACKVELHPTSSSSTN